jgi:hypothetical protein
MKQGFAMRSWPRNKLIRLREMWWDGKSPAQIAKILQIPDPKLVWEKAKREGFIRDPRRADQGPSELLPMPRPGGQLVTLANCTKLECRWPYGPVCPAMILCGRPMDGAPYCGAHHVLAGTKQKVGAR